MRIHILEKDEFWGVSVRGIEYHPDMQIQHCYRQPRQRKTVGVLHVAILESY